jgi:hypothetical protein
MATRPRKDQILFHTLRRREIGGKGRGIQSATILTRQIYSAITPNETLYNVELPENFVPRRFTPDGKVSICVKLPLTHPAQIPPHPQPYFAIAFDRFHSSRRYYSYLFVPVPSTAFDRVSGRPTVGAKNSRRHAVHHCGQ